MQVGQRLENRSPGSRIAKEALLPESDRPDDQRNDAQFLEECRSGSVAAFERLYERHGARMKSIAANLLGSVTDAEDAVQDCFLKIYRGSSSFRGDARFSTWIYRVLVNSCYDMLRSSRRRPLETRSETKTYESDADPSAPVSDHPLRLSLEACVRDLDPRRRTAFLLFAVEGFTHREVGEILGVPEGTSKTLLFEARRELQRNLFKKGVARRADA